MELLKHFETTGDEVQYTIEDRVDDFVERIHTRLTDSLRRRIQNIRRELQASSVVQQQRSVIISYHIIS